MVVLRRRLVVVLNHGMGLLSAAVSRRPSSRPTPLTQVSGSPKVQVTGSPKVQVNGSPQAQVTGSPKV